MARLATIAAFGFADFNPPTLLPLYRRLGCMAGQFYRNTADPPEPNEARRIMADAGVPCDSIHGLFGAELDPSSPDDPTRRRAVQTYRLEGELALSLGGPRVVVHPAPMARDAAAISPASRAARVDPLRHSMDELADIGERLGVIYLLENIPDTYHFGSDPIQLAQLIRTLNHPNVRMCFDTGHAHMCRLRLGETLDACRDVIGYVHVNDNDAAQDSHQIPGLGTIPWDALAPHMADLPAATPAMLELFYSEADITQAIGQGLAEQLRRWLAIRG